MPTVTVEELIALTNRPSSQADKAKESPEAEEALGQRIVVLDRGFVFVGKVRTAGNNLVIENARCIRKWGTTKGLGELRNGPTSDTVLDDSGTVVAPKRAVIFTIVCTRAW